MPSGLRGRRWWRRRGPRVRRRATVNRRRRSGNVLRLEFWFQGLLRARFWLGSGLDPRLDRRGGIVWRNGSGLWDGAAVYRRGGSSVHRSRPASPAKNCREYPPDHAERQKQDAAQGPSPGHQTCRRATVDGSGGRTFRRRHPVDGCSRFARCFHLCLEFLFGEQTPSGFFAKTAEVPFVLRRSWQTRVRVRRQCGTSFAGCLKTLVSSACFAGFSTRKAKDPEALKHAPHIKESPSYSSPGPFSRSMSRYICIRYKCAAWFSAVFGKLALWIESLRRRLP
jgi:hypothetical protein